MPGRFDLVIIFILLLIFIIEENFFRNKFFYSDWFCQEFDSNLDSILIQNLNDL